MGNINPGPFYFFPFMPIHKVVEEDKKDVAYYDEIYSPELTLLHGNAFKNEYVAYKNYAPSIPFAKDQQEKLLRGIQMNSLLAHDLKLHLDVYPKDRAIYELFKKYADETHRLVKEYQDKFDPLFAGGSKFEGMFTWVGNPHGERY